jgi:putative MATE family efflux protein
MGAGVVIARAYGAKEYDTMSKAIHTAIAFGIVCGAALTVVGVALTPVILRWMGTPAEVLPQSVEYFRYYFMGALFTVIYNIFVGIFHAVGDSRHPLYYLIFASFVNIALDMFFVAVLGFGVGAAAMATTLSQGVSALLCFLHIIRVDAPYRVNVRKIRFHKEILVQIIRYGLPSGVQNSVIALANVVVQTNINSFGKAAMAGCGAYSKLEGFAFLPVTCFTQALSTFVGQNLGAGKHDRVRKGVAFGILCSCTMAEITGLLLYRFAPQLIGFFSESQAAIEFGARHMRTICLFYCLLAFSHCIGAILRGAGKPTVPMLTSLGSWCLFRVVYITVAVKFVNELTTVSWAYPITWILSGIIFLIYFLFGDWIHNFDRESQRT